MNFFRNSPKKEVKIEPEIQNVNLVKGVCPVCGKRVEDEEVLGSMCDACEKTRNYRSFFTPANIGFPEIKPEIYYDPLLGRYEYFFDWKGVRVKINNTDGVVTSTQADMGWVDFPNYQFDAIRGLSYWDLIDIYSQTGSPVQPPPLNLPPYRAKVIPYQKVRFSG